MTHHSMNTETQVSPATETEIPVADATEIQPEVVEPDDSDANKAADPSEPTESEEAKTLKRLQRRIDKRTADVYRERAEKEQLAQRLAQLEAKEPTEPKEQDFESSVRAQAREIAKAERINEKCNSVAEEGKKLEGFAESIRTLSEEAPLFDRHGRPTQLMEVVLEAEKPAALLHYLGKNPEVAADLADLSPTQLARRLDRIERDLSAPPKTSKAPAPIDPVGGKGGAVQSLDTSDFAAYEAMRAKQGARWARR